jgi:hypothetical protein
MGHALREVGGHDDEVVEGEHPCIRHIERSRSQRDRQ